MMKYLTRNMKVQFIMAGKTRQLKREAAGYVVSTVRIQRDGCWHSAHFLLFIKSKILDYGMESLPFRMGLPSASNLV